MCNQSKTTLPRTKMCVFFQRCNKNSAAAKPKVFTLSAKPAGRWTQLLNYGQLKKNSVYWWFSLLKWKLSKPCPATVCFGSFWSRTWCLCMAGLSQGVSYICSRHPWGRLWSTSNDVRCLGTWIPHSVLQWDSESGCGTCILMVPMWEGDLDHPKVISWSTLSCVAWINEVFKEEEFLAGIYPPPFLPHIPTELVWG